MKRIGGIAVLLVGCLLLFSLIRPSDPLRDFPRLMLWAWEAPQDLRFIVPGRAGIAFLSRTVWLAPGRAYSRPRLQPLRYTPGTDLMAVVRFESEGHGLPDSANVIREVAPAFEMDGVRAIQIDFDARASERAWYRTFLRDLRRQLPANQLLTITALESWCEEKGWLDALPIDEATPMLFRMGPGDRPAPTGFPAKICGSSAGVSTDELPARIPRVRRIYFFHPGSWTQAGYEAAQGQAGRWAR